VLLGLARVEGGEPGMRRLAQALEAAPQGPAAEEALLRLGEALAERGEAGRAAQTYEQLVSINPRGAYAPAARYALAWLRYEGGDLEAASRSLAPLLAAAETSEDLAIAARELELWCRAGRGDARAAAGAWLELARACEDDERLLAALEAALGACRESGDLRAGGELLQAFLDREPRPALVAEALVEGAWLALDADQVDVAESAVRSGVRVLPREALGGERAAALAEAAFFVGEARHARGEAARAADLYALAEPLAAGELAARVAYKRGFVALEAGDLDAAERAFAVLVEEHADSELHGEGLYLLGETRCRREDWRGAIAPLRELVRASPRHESVPKARFRLGLAAGHLGQWALCEQSLGDLLRAQRDFPLAAEAQLWRGRALAARGDTRGARVAFDAVLDSDRGELGAAARLELGHLARASGDLDAALSDYLKVAVLYAHPASVTEALVCAGECLEAQGQRDAAIARYREALADHPDQPAAARARERLRALQGD
jgi:TolA-binding protein